MTTWERPLGPHRVELSGKLLEHFGDREDLVFFPYNRGQPTGVITTVQRFLSNRIVLAVVRPDLLVVSDVEVIGSVGEIALTTPVDPFDGTHHIDGVEHEET